MSNIASLIDIHDGDAWEKLAFRLLHLKYGSNNVQEVPAAHGGDWGIDFYTVNGEAFQCYAPDKAYSTDDLYSHQRSKITTDIGKFISNKAELEKLIAPTKYSRWHFLTTVHTSKNLNAHAAKKSKEVSEQCDHVAPDFCIMIHTGENFFVDAIGKFVSLGLQKLSIQLDQHLNLDSSNFKSLNSDQFENVKRKIRSAGISEDRIGRISESYIKDYLTANSLKANLKNTSIQLYEIVERRITSLEIDVARKYDLQPASSTDDLEKELVQLRVALQTDVGSMIDSTTIDYITRGVLADWLLRCPIEF